MWERRKAQWAKQLCSTIVRVLAECRGQIHALSQHSTRFGGPGPEGLLSRSLGPLWQAADRKGCDTVSNLAAAAQDQTGLLSIPENRSALDPKNSSLPQSLGDSELLTFTIPTSLVSSEDPEHGALLLRD
jgi:hypothetical protein